MAYLAHYPELHNRTSAGGSADIWDILNFLQELYLDQNDLRDIPPELALLPGLRKLYLNSQEGEGGPAQAGDARGMPHMAQELRDAQVVKGSVPYT